MKKIILVALVCLFTLSIHAKSKIDRTIYGCTLGVTTSEQAEDILDKQGYFKLGGGDMIILFNPKYADQKWLVAAFQFENGVLDAVMFIQSNTNIFAKLFEGVKAIPMVDKLINKMTGDSTPQELDPLYQKLKKWAKSEYDGCKFKEVTDADLKKDSQLPKRSFIYTDGRVAMAVVSLNVGESIEILSLGYTLK